MTDDQNDPDMHYIEARQQKAESKIDAKKEAEDKKYDKEPVEIDQAKAKYRDSLRQYQAAEPDRKKEAKEKVENSLKDLEKEAESFSSKPAEKEGDKKEESA